jgi:Spy/CpxP family protein refolding chaperone
MGINSAKLLSAFSSVLALAVILPGIAVNSASVLAQSTTTPGTSAPGGATSLQKINLSPAQRQQIRLLVKQRNSEIEGVLDKNTQLPKFTQALSSGKKVNQALQGLNLSADQQSKIKTIMDTYREKAKAVISQSPSTAPSSMPSPAK